MKVVVTGASGFIGSALVPALREAGHDVLTLVRRPPRAPGEIAWDPDRLALDAGALAGVDAAINLAGAPVGTHRWTRAYRRTIHDSRVHSTHTLASALATLDPLPRVLVSGSASGWYGDTGDREVDEATPAADDFLARVVVDWETATTPAQAAGIRVVHARTGLVLDPRGGALQRQLPLFRLGLGGRLGSGRQWWSFITLEDEIRALLHLLDDDTLHGPVNFTAPEPARNADVTRALAAALHRPAVFAVPGPALRLALGGFADSIVGSQRIRPRVLLEHGFSFRHPDLATAISAVVAPPAH